MEDETVSCNLGKDPMKLLFIEKRPARWS